MDHNLLTLLLYLQQFNFSFKHRSGKNHGNADAMSRVLATSSVLAIFQQLVTDSSTIKTAQQTDKALSQLIMALTQGHPLPSG